MDWRHRVLLILGVFALAKSAWGIVAPESVKKATQWWMKVVGQVNTLMGIVALLLGAGLWVLVLRNQDLVDWLLVLMGILFAWAATIYFRKDDLEKLVNAIIIGRKPAFIRIISVIAALLGAFFIWAAIFK